MLVTTALNALDGFDVLAITFAAPAIARNWHVDKGVLGAVFSAGLLGMAFGSFFLAPFADRVGRRVVALCSLALMVLGTLWTARAGGTGSLIASRLFTGLGIGSMIAVINPLAAEYANTRRRDLALSLLNVGYPAGGLIGGIVAALLLSSYGWQAVFVTASALGAVMMVIVWLLMPEPASFLLARPGPRNLVRLNAYLRRCGVPEVDEVPPAQPVDRVPTAALFRSGMRRVTLTITAIYLLFVVTLFFMQNWLPTLVADVGFSAADAARIAIWLSIGGIAGGLSVGVLSPRFGLKPTVTGMIGASFCLVALFGLVPGNFKLLQLAGAVVGFAIYGGIIGLYAVVSRSFPVTMRASGTGFVIGIGRLGSVLSPLIASALFHSGLAREGVCLVLALPALIAGLILLSYRIQLNVSP